MSLNNYVQFLRANNALHNIPTENVTELLAGQRLVVVVGTNVYSNGYVFEGQLLNIEGQDYIFQIVHQLFPALAQPLPQRVLRFRRSHNLVVDFFYYFDDGTVAPPLDPRPDLTQRNTPFTLEPFTTDRRHSSRKTPKRGGRSIKKRRRKSRRNRRSR